MSKNGQATKLKLLKIMDYLLKETDDEHRVSVLDIIAHLEAQGIQSERKSIYTYIDLLESYGLDIITEREHQNHYHVGNRTFQLAELKLLVDAVMFSKFITDEKSQDLVDKLKTLTSVYEAKKLERSDLITNRLKTKNNAVYINVDAIHEAILLKRKLRFKYFDYNLKKEMIYRRQGEFYTVIPVFLCWDDEKYYCVTYHEQHQDYVVYRVDKMREVNVSQQIHAIEAKPENLDKYLASIFNMFAGEEKRLVLEFHQDLLNVVLDRFGLDANISPKDASHFILTQDVLVSPTFLSWLFQFESKVKILEPDDVKAMYVNMLRQNIEMYE
jgi:predicted DNA-binding transcriptional regulator YafY